MFQGKVKILYNKKGGPKYRHLALAADRIARQALPGQFVNLRVADSLEPLLRRPLSIHRVAGSRIELLYEVVGKGTQALSGRKPGEYLDVIGPLGNGFDFQSQAISHKSQVLVAGGMGVAPLIFLAEKLKRRNPLVLIGGKSKEDILCAQEFRRLGCTVKIATDNGSKGFKGRVTELLRKILLETGNWKLETVYACGPRPMLKEISRIAQRYAIPAQVSLEEHMACGIGACLGCVVDTTQGFKRVCKEGPVFDARKIIW